jgi:hypothetical protein
MRYEPRVSSDSGAASDEQRSKLRRIAHAAQRAALGGMALVVAYSAYLFANHTALITYLQRDIPGATIAPGGGAVTLAGAPSLIPIAIFVAAVWQAGGLFRLFGRRQFFDPAAPRLLVRLGGFAVVAAVGGIVVRTLVALLMTSANPRANGSSSSKLARTRSPS